MSVYLARPRLFLSFPIDINYRCSVQRSDPHLQQMERISDISGRNRLRSGAIISSRLTSPCFRSFSQNLPAEGRGRRAFSHRGWKKDCFSAFLSSFLLAPHLLSFSLVCLFRASLRHSRAFSRLAGTIYHSVS